MRAMRMRFQNVIFTSRQLVHAVRLVVCACLAVAVFLPAALGEPPAARNETKQQKSLDEALLEDLDAGLPKPATANKRAAKDEKQAPATGESPPIKKPGRSDLDDDLLDGLEGEDVMPGSENENPLLRLNERMKQVERRIAETRSDEKTQRLQQEIADDLSKLIEQLQQQNQKSKSPSQSPRQQQTTGTKPAAQSADQPNDKPGDKPARDSTQHTKERGAAKVDGARLQERLKDVWGHLPPHLRQQMEQSANEEFLPKYETEISEYYRSLVGGRKERK